MGQQSSLGLLCTLGADPAAHAGAWKSAVLHALLTLQVPEALGFETLTAGQLAAKTGVPAPQQQPSTCMA